VSQDIGWFDDILCDPFAGRSAKPRREGLTMVIDKGLGLAETEGVLLLAHGYVDYWKLPFGTPALYARPLLQQKVALVRRFGLAVYPGGTFLEVAVLQGQVEAFLDRCGEIGFTAVEVSDGTIPLDPGERRALIRAARARGLRVVSEVGKKDAHARVTVAQLHRSIEEDLAAGSERIIVEGRESGVSVGVYNERGAILEDELAKILSGVPDPSVLIWEAPRKSQQEEFILRFGPNVNLGNIPPGEVLALEALRRGLRSDTLKACLPQAASEGA
jgi:phosphosulfolactate synthase